MYTFAYYPVSSFIHELEARTKIIFVIAYSMVVMQFDTLGLLTTAAGFVIFCSLLARIPTGIFLKTLRPVMPFFLILFLVYIFFTPGTAFIVIGPLQVSANGLEMGFIQVGKFILLVLAASLLTMSTNVSALTSGLERLLSPMNKIGLSSYDIAMMVTLAIRFIPTLIEEKNSLNEAQLSRNSNRNSLKLKGKIRSAAYLALPLTMQLLRRCEELIDAMEARGYKQGPRTGLYETTLNRLDYFLIGVIILGAVLCLMSI